MDSSQVTRWRARSIMSRFDPMRDYLCRLRSRMARRGLPPEHLLVGLVVSAWDAVNLLHADVHCRSIDGPGFNPRKS